MMNGMELTEIIVNWNGQDHNVWAAACEAFMSENLYMMFREDGSRINCECRIGRTGKALHTAGCFYDARIDYVVTNYRGYEGNTWMGHGARIVKVNF